MSEIGFKSVPAAGRFPGGAQDRTSSTWKEPGGGPDVEDVFLLKNI